MHGMWTSDATVTTSDRRLKRDIVPVEAAVAELGAVQSGAGQGPSDATLSWLLRSLRPVAYRFKRGAESKYQRFGFIADEVRALLPDLTRPIDKDDRSEDPVSGLVYSDLIALLVAQLQRLEARINRLEQAPPAAPEARTSEQPIRLQDVAAQLQEQERKLAALHQQVEELQARCPADSATGRRDPTLHTP